jgi:hypothetical protein
MHEVGGPPANAGCSQEKRKRLQEQQLSVLWDLPRAGEACENITLSLLPLFCLSWRGFTLVNLLLIL